MKKRILIMLCAILASGAFPALSSAEVTIERHGIENPVTEVFKSTVYGALGGLAVGGAITLAAESDGGEILRWSIVGGTAIGLAAGIYFVSKRPQPSALLEYKNGEVSFHPPTPQIDPGGGVGVQLFAAQF